MQLPAEIRRRIEGRAEEVGFSTLKRAADAMSAGYREGRPGKLDVTAYLVTRMPATYAASYTALRQLRMGISSVLDVGAGTGAASVAAREVFPGARITLIERDRALAEVAQEWLPDAELRTEDATRAELPEADLVIGSYSVGEFGAAVARRMWAAAKVAMVVIEPGTPRGFATIRGIRDELLAAGAHMAAPCPMESACPVIEPDWCHFAARVERSSMHRRVKGGDLGYEDEKYSYVALTREPVEMAAARIVRRPRHQAGLIVIDTCTASGLTTERVTKRDKERFRKARQASWGDAI